MIIGAHLPIGKGIFRAAELAADLELGALQMFTRSPRGGKARAWPDTEVTRFKGTVADSSLDPVVVHIPYLVNLAADRPDIRHYGQDVFMDDLQRAVRLGARFLVLHPGSHRSLTRDEGYEYLGEALSRALAEELPVRILLENMAGQGSELGSNIAELATFAAAVDRRIGICLDTCHAFAAGYDVRDQAVIAQLFMSCEDIIGSGAIALVHINDSRYDLGEHRDRHANIGDGLITTAGFVPIVQRCSEQNIPMILETPVDNPLDYRFDITTVRQLI